LLSASQSKHPQLPLARMTLNGTRRADKEPLVFGATIMFERYFPTTKYPRTAKEWICDPFVNKPGESSISMQEEDQLLEIANDGGLKNGTVSLQRNKLRAPTDLAL
ncbi:hypothetical protein JOQ06_027022, partial [Pogonophryne albipinna]